jgi:DNA-binding NarL/FixJ family response regulator
MTTTGGAGKAPAKASPCQFRILLADDHEDLLQEIRELLTSDFDVVGAVGNGQALIDAARALRPDVVVSDIKMPGISGIEACRRIVQEGLCSTTIVLTMYNEAQLVRRALGAGIRGYLLKMHASEELIPAIRSVMNGFTYLSTGVQEPWMKQGPAEPAFSNPQMSLKRSDQAED